jgi:hypothetical protein
MLWGSIFADKVKYNTTAHRAKTNRAMALKKAE